MDMPQNLIFFAPGDREGTLCGAQSAGGQHPQTVGRLSGRALLSLKKCEAQSTVRAMCHRKFTAHGHGKPCALPAGLARRSPARKSYFAPLYR